MSFSEGKKEAPNLTHMHQRQVDEIKINSLRNRIN